MVPFQVEPEWLTAATNAPLAAAVFWMLHGIRRERAAPPAEADGDALERTRDELAAFKLEVARTYVPLSLIRDVDQRLTQHLLRIEEKLDEAARAATAAAASVQQCHRIIQREDR